MLVSSSSSSLSYLLVLLLVEQLPVSYRNIPSIRETSTTPKQASVLLAATSKHPSLSSSRQFSSALGSSGHCQPLLLPLLLPLVRVDSSAFFSLSILPLQEQRQWVLPRQSSLPLASSPLLLEAFGLLALL